MKLFNVFNICKSCEECCECVSDCSPAILTLAFVIGFLVCFILIVLLNYLIRLGFFNR